MLHEIDSRFDLNIARVERQVAAYVQARGAGKGRRKLSQTDLLRAAVVMLHASLEDFLRSLCAWKFPTSGTGVLDGIPLVKTKGKVKFNLADLHALRGKSVLEVIAESISEYLNHMSYNNTSEVMAVLEQLRVPTAPLKVLLPRLDEAMKRRHHIVHQADRQTEHGRGFGKAKAIDETMVNGWLSAVRRLRRHVVTSLG